jgi:hypothetical protein
MSKKAPQLNLRIYWVILIVSAFVFRTPLIAAGESGETQIEVTVINPATPPSTSPTPTPSLPLAKTDQPEAPASSAGCSKASPGQEAPYLTRALRVSETALELEFLPAQKPWTHYVLRYGLANGGFSFGGIIDNPETGRFTINSLDSGKAYQFQIFAVNDCAPGPDSNILVVALAGYNQDSLLGQIIKSSGIEVGEVVLAPDQILPLDDGVAASGDFGAIEKKGGVLASFFGWGVCRFDGWWWWLCWPWWVIVILTIILTRYAQKRRERRFIHQRYSKRRRFKSVRLYSSRRWN